MRHDNNVAKSIATRRRNKELRREFMGKYTFIAGQKKPCLNCQCEFMPVFTEHNTKMRKFHDKTLYATSLFCKLTCEMEYIHKAINDNAAPRAVSRQLDKSDINKGVSMTQGAKWRADKKERDAK